MAVWIEIPDKTGGIIPDSPPGFTKWDYTCAPGIFIYSSKRQLNNQKDKKNTNRSARVKNRREPGRHPRLSLRRRRREIALRPSV
jgi:hypothetical protein